jgi:hypothetical protein
VKASVRGSLVTIGIGIFGAAAALILGILVWPASWVTRVYVWPGEALMPVIGRALPDRLAYAIVPEGGPPAASLLVLLGSSVAWGIASVAIWMLGRRATSSLRQLSMSR